MSIYRGFHGISHCHVWLLEGNRLFTYVLYIYICNGEIMGNLTTSWYNPDILGFEWFDWNSLSLYGEWIWPFRSRLQHQPAAASSEFTTASIAVGDLRYPQITMANSYCRWLLVSPWLVSHTSFVLSYRHFSWGSSCNSNAIHPQTLDPLSVPHPLALVYTQRAHFIRVKSAQTPGRKFPVFEICCISVSISNVFSQEKDFQDISINCQIPL